MIENEEKKGDQKRVRVDTVRIIMDKYQFIPEFTSRPEQLLKDSNSIHNLKAKRLRVPEEEQYTVI